MTTQDPQARRRPSRDGRPTSRRTGGGEGPRRKKRRPAEEASEQARNVGSEAQQEAQATAETARAEASAVAETAQQEAGSVLETGMAALEQQAGKQTEQLVEKLYDYRDEMDALLQGEPEQAGQVRDAVQRLADRTTDVADRMAEGGPRGMVEDAKDLAGRRPGVFLLGAAVAGFGIGRLLRATRDSDDDLVERERSAVDDEPRYAEDDS
jgi:hypothetical protein